MYLVELFDNVNDKKGTIIHTPYGNGHKLSNGVISLVGDGIDSFKFTINPSNPGWNKVRPLVTLIKVTDVNSAELVFDGRILKPIQTMTANGEFHIQFLAEDKLGYLWDSTQRHGEYNNMTVEEFLKAIVDQHNRQVEPHKRFEVGKVTVTTSTDNVYRFLGYEKTWDAIQEKLVDRLGGHVRLRDGKYIDYLETVGEYREKPIRLRSNLKSMRKEIDPTEIITRLVPLGARIESEEGPGISDPRLTIESVNNGLDYVDDPLLIKEFGIIEDNIVYDDINTPSTLKLRADQFFNAQRAVRVSYNVTTPNMHLIDTRFEEYKVDNYYPIDNPVFAINEPIQVVAKDIDINNPKLSELTIGDKNRTLSEYQAQANKKMITVERLEERVDSLGTQNARLSQQLETAQGRLNTIQEDLFNVDLENLPQELQSIGQQLLALEQLLNDIDIPEYDLATPYESGLMSSQDKMKLDLIHTTTIVDLDDVLARLEVLEEPEEEI